MSSEVFDSFEMEMKKPEISMAPLIDMVFLLLIFFVVTTSFTKETGIKVDKARAATSQSINSKSIMIISMDKSGQYWYDGSSRSLDEIVAITLENNKRNRDLSIVVVPDRHAEIEPLIRIMDRLRANNISRFSLGTQLVDK